MSPPHWRSPIREILSSIEDKEITAFQTDLFFEILQTFKELVETLEETDVNGVRNLLYKLLPSIIEDDSSKNKKIKEEINLILDLINGSHIVSYFAGFKIISGQPPLLIKKKTFSQFGGNRDIVGGKVTLRGYRPYSFISKLLFDVFPDIRQFIFSVVLETEDAESFLFHSRLKPSSADALVALSLRSFDRWYTLALLCSARSVPRPAVLHVPALLSWCCRPGR